MLERTAVSRKSMALSLAVTVDGSIGEDCGVGNVEGWGGEEESNTPQIAPSVWSWKDRFLDPFCGLLHPFLIASLHFLRLLVFFSQIFASSISFDLIQPLLKSKRES